MGELRSALNQRRDGGIRTSDATAAGRHQEIARGDIERLRDRCLLARSGLVCAHIESRRAREAGDHVRRRGCARYIDDT